MSGIGLSGAQRTGKTTLAMEFSRETDIPFVETSTSDVFKELKLDVKSNFNFRQRMDVQWRILESAVNKYYQAKSGMFITDRTPIDMLAYTMSQIDMSSVSGGLEHDFIRYRDVCIDATNNFFSIMVIIQPGIKLVEEEGKGAANLPHMEHINSLILGLAADENLNVQHTHIPRHITDLQQRVKCVDESIRIASNTFEKFAIRRGATHVSKNLH